MKFKNLNTGCLLMGGIVLGLALSGGVAATVMKAQRRTKCRAPLESEPAESQEVPQPHAHVLVIAGSGKGKSFYLNQILALAPQREQEIIGIIKILEQSASTVDFAGTYREADSLIDLAYDIAQTQLHRGIGPEKILLIHNLPELFSRHPYHSERTDAETAMKLEAILEAGHRSGVKIYAGHNPEYEMDDKLRTRVWESFERGGIVVEHKGRGFLNEDGALYVA